MPDNIPKAIVQKQNDSTPIENRVGTLEEVAMIVGWLAGEESRRVTGQTISASGAWAMY
jgi:3-oxoacyl-[acyl-carrier protein] reductase